MTAPARPNRHLPLVREAACTALLPDYQRWLGRPAGYEKSADLRDLLRCAATGGYAFAKALQDRCDIEPDAELVEVLEGYSACEDEVLARLVAQWVSENSIPTPFAVGQRIRHADYGDGTVSGLRYAEAIVIFVPDDKADRFRGMEGCGYLLNAEDLTAIVPPRPKPFRRITMAIGRWLHG